MPAERSYVPDVPTALMTADELLHAPIANKRTELVRGVLVVREPPGGLHGIATARLGAQLLVQPGASERPVPTHRGWRRTERLGRLLETQASEELAFHYPSFSLVDLLESRERVVDRDEVVEWTFIGRDPFLEDVVERRRGDATTSLDRATPHGVIHEDIAHGA